MKVRSTYGELGIDPLTGQVRSKAIYEEKGKFLQSIVKFDLVRFYNEHNEMHDEFDILCLGYWYERPDGSSGYQDPCQPNELWCRYCKYHKPKELKMLSVPKPCQHCQKLERELNVARSYREGVEMEIADKLDGQLYKIAGWEGDASVPRGTHAIVAYELRTHLIEVEIQTDDELPFSGKVKITDRDDVRLSVGYMLSGITRRQKGNRIETLAVYEVDLPEVD